MTTKHEGPLVRFSSIQLHIHLFSHSVFSYSLMYIAGFGIKDDGHNRYPQEITVPFLEFNNRYKLMTCFIWIIVLEGSQESTFVGEHLRSQIS